jgi:FkbM family methyltransferase
MIYSFEPLPDCIAQIEMLARAGSNVRVFPYACGDSNSVIEFHRSTFSPSSSLLPMATRHKELFPFTAGGTTLEVEVRCLDDVLDSEDLQDRILVKLDVQGFEDRVIRGGRAIITRSAVVLTEMNFERLYENQADFDLTYRSLMDCGFEFRGMWEQSVDRETGCPIFGDALFTRGR